MTAEELSDERRNYIAVQKIIDTMLEFDVETRGRILRTVSTFFGIDANVSESEGQDTNTQSAVPAFSGREDLTPKDFLFQKKPKTDVERVACLAYYLTHFRSIAHFKTTDISKLNTEAAQIKFSNASNAVNNATQSGFLVPAAQGSKQISAPGERFVDMLPAHPAARKIMSEMRPRRRRKSNKDASVSPSNSGAANP